MTLAVDFDGSGGSVSLPSIDVDGSNGWSVQAWVRMREVGNWARVLELSNGAGRGNLFLSAVGSTRAFGLHQWVDGGVQGALHGDTLRLNEWVHLSGTISASGKTCLYVNGLLVECVQGPPVRDGVRAANWIGKSAWSHDAPWRGQMTELRLYRVTLSEHDIAANWNHRATGDEEGLLACWPLTGCGGVGASIPDIGPLGLHGTAGSGLGGVSDGPGLLLDSAAMRRRALKLDGQSYVRLPSLALGPAVTLMAWVRPTQLRKWQRVVEFANGAPDGNVALALDGESTDLALYVAHGADGDGSVVTAPHAVPLHQWVHVAATVSADGLATLYVNGRMAGQRQLAASLLGGTRGFGYLGKSAFAQDENWRGSLADVRIYGACLSPERMALAPDSELPDDTGWLADLLAAWPLVDSAQGNTSRQALDCGPSQLHGTLNTEDLLPGFSSAGPYAGGGLVAALAPPLCGAPAFRFVSGSGSFGEVSMPLPRGNFDQGLSFEAWVHAPAPDDQALVAMSLWSQTYSDALGGVAFKLVWTGTHWDVAIDVRQPTSGAAVPSRLRSVPLTLPAGSWSHLAFTFGPDTVFKVYVNGALRADVLHGGRYPRIDARSIPVAVKLGAAMSLADVRVWEGVLTQRQVAGFWSRRVDPRAAGLRVNWRMDEYDTSTQLRDSGPLRLHWRAKGGGIVAQGVPSGSHGRQGPALPRSWRVVSVGALRGEDWVNLPQGDGTLVEGFRTLQELDLMFSAPDGSPLVLASVSVSPSARIQVLECGEDGLTRVNALDAGAALRLRTDAAGRLRLRLLVQDQFFMPDLYLRVDGQPDTRVLRVDEAAWDELRLMGGGSMGAALQASGQSSEDASASASLFVDLADAFGADAPRDGAAVAGIGSAYRLIKQELDNAGSGLKSIADSLESLGTKGITQVTGASAGAAVWVRSARQAANQASEEFKHLVASARRCAFNPVSSATLEYVVNAQEIAIDLSGQLDETGRVVEGAVQVVGVVLLNGTRQVFRVIVTTAQEAWEVMQALAKRLAAVLEDLLNRLAKLWRLWEFFERAWWFHQCLTEAMTGYRPLSAARWWEVLPSSLPAVDPAGQWTLGDMLGVGSLEIAKLPKEVTWFNDHLNRYLSVVTEGIAGFEALLAAACEQLWGLMPDGLIEPITSQIEAFGAQVQEWAGRYDSFTDVPLAELADVGNRFLGVVHSDAFRASWALLAPYLDQAIDILWTLYKDLLTRELVMPEYVTYLQNMLGKDLLEKTIEGPFRFDALWIPAFLCSAAAHANVDKWGVSADNAVSADDALFGESSRVQASAAAATSLLKAGFNDQKYDQAEFALGVAASVAAGVLAGIEVGQEGKSTEAASVRRTRLLCTFLLGGFTLMSSAVGLARDGEGDTAYAVAAGSLADGALVLAPVALEVFQKEPPAWFDKFMAYAGSGTFIYSTVGGLVQLSQGWAHGGEGLSQDELQKTRTADCIGALGIPATSALRLVLDYLEDEQRKIQLNPNMPPNTANRAAWLRQRYTLGKWGCISAITLQAMVGLAVVR